MNPMMNQFPGYGMRMHPHFPQQHQHPQQLHQVPHPQQPLPPHQQDHPQQPPPQYFDAPKGAEGAESDDLSATENTGPNLNQHLRQHQHQQPPQFPGFNMQQPGYYPVPYMPHQPQIRFPARAPQFMGYYDEGGRGGGAGRRGGGRGPGRVGGRGRRGGGRGSRGGGRYNSQGYGPHDSDRSFSGPDGPEGIQPQQQQQNQPYPLEPDMGPPAADDAPQ